MRDIRPKGFSRGPAIGSGLGRFGYGNRLDPRYTP
jgi:hypothetical protein